MLGSEPTEIAPRCFAQQLDARERLEENWGDIRSFMMEVFDWAGVEAIEAEELSVIPGLDELFALTEVEALCQSGDYDVVVVDCAPTAETIRLLSLPDILSWYMDRLYPGVAAGEPDGRADRVAAPPRCRWRTTRCSPRVGGSTTSSSRCAGCCRTRRSPRPAWS